MPRLKKTEYDRKTDEITTAIKVAMIRKEMRQADLAKVMHKSRQTISRNIQDIDHMSVGDFRIMMTYLGLDFVIRE